MAKLKYFEPIEFVMGEMVVFDRMDETLLYMLDELRDDVGEALHINSSFRNYEYNDKIGGSPNSQHIHGKAVDIACDNSVLRHNILASAMSIGFTGIGVAKTFIHLDNRDTIPVVWTY